MTNRKIASSSVLVQTATALRSGRVSEDGQFLAVEGAQTTAGNDLRVKSTVKAKAG